MLLRTFYSGYSFVNELNRRKQRCSSKANVLSRCRQTTFAFVSKADILQYGTIAKLEAEDFCKKHLPRSKIPLPAIRRPGSCFAPMPTAKTKSQTPLHSSGKPRRFHLRLFVPLLFVFPKQSMQPARQHESTNLRIRHLYT